MRGITLYGAQLSYRDAVDLVRLGEERGFDAASVAETFARPLRTGPPAPSPRRS